MGRFLHEAKRKDCLLSLPRAVVVAFQFPVSGVPAASVLVKKRAGEVVKKRKRKEIRRASALEVTIETNR
jgi:hypothetical protein